MNVTPLRVVTADELRQELLAFEQRYGMTSAVFLGRWNEGAIEETPPLDGLDGAAHVLDYFRWAGACVVARKLGLVR